MQERRPLPARAPRRRGALRLRGRPSLVEAVSAAAAHPALACARARDDGVRGRGGTARGDGRSRSSACARASCTGSRSRTACCSAAATSTATTRRAAKDAFIVAVNCFEPGGTCFCVSMGTGPKAESGYDLALTEILDGDAPLPRRGRQRARRRGPRATLPRRAGATRPTSKPPARPSRAPPSEMGRAARHDRHARAARAQPRAPALGRGRRALPHLRQLHARLPDLLLHERRGRHRPRPATTPSASRSGTRASRSTTRTSTAAASARPAARATASG